MLETIESIIIIITTILLTTITIISSFYGLQKNLRGSIDEMLEKRDNNIKIIIGKRINEYRNEVNKQIKLLGIRIYKIEKDEK